PPRPPVVLRASRTRALRPAPGTLAPTALTSPRPQTLPLSPGNGAHTPDPHLEPVAASPR
ncbi:hypothetical protein P7K49_019069, partial [Saguinus oedipus]